MVGYEVVDTQTVNADNSIEVSIFSPIESSIETNDSVCCGTPHNKKLSVRSGMEWPNSVFPWWIHRVEGPWSAFSNSFGVSTSEILGDENDVTMYVQTKSDHAVTNAALSITSELFIKDQWGNWVLLQPAFIKAYPSLDYPLVGSILGDNLYTENWLPGPTRHQTTMNISAIS